VAWTLILNVEKELVLALERRAQTNGRSLEDEARAILQKFFDEEDLRISPDAEE
jgi:plasmid stability protein